MKPKILFDSKDHPEMNSGYGIISRYLLPLLGKHYGKDNIIIYPPVYQRDHISEWEGMLCVGGTEFSYGENLIWDHYSHYGCNLLLMVGDAWPLGIVPDLAAENKVLWVQWLPVDWLGMPKNITNRIKYAHKLVPFSRYGEASLRKHNFTNVDKAIWLGLNTELWKPKPRESLPDFMNLLGYQLDSFNILIVGANQARKQIRPALEAIASFRKVNLQADVRLYMHTHMTGERDFRADIDELGLVDILCHQEPYLASQGGASEQDMVGVFNCADVVINCCLEGFGYAMLQAQAVGVPVIGLSEGTGPELIKFGIEIPSVAVETSPHQMSQPIPSIPAMVAALDELYKKRMALGAPLRNQKAVDFVRDNFSWGKIAKQWVGVIDKCMEDREKFCMQIPDPSEELNSLSSKLKVIL